LYCNKNLIYRSITKMKTTLRILTALALLTFFTTQLNAETKAGIEPVKTAESPEVKALINRLEELKAMDKSNLTRAQKKQYRDEVKGIKQTLHTMDGGGIYISVGALIIIILLLFIFVIH